MIKINNNEINVQHFPDGTQRLLDINMPTDKNKNLLFDWKYQSDEEIITLIYLVNHFREHNYIGEYILNMMFVSNSRMDRIHHDKEVFTLKWFCKMINDLHFNEVFVLDPHSNVAPALLNNVIVIQPTEFINKVVQEIDKDNLILYYPDFGAYKKYSELLSDNLFCYGKKVRDWDTGKILGLEIENEMNIDLIGKTVLMVDDIIAYGGSMHFGALKLKELGVNEIYAYATHTEKSILDREKGTLIKDLENNTVERLFTTNSLFSGNHEKITVMEV